MFCHENSFLACKGSEEHPLRSRSEERLPLTQSHDQLSHCYVQALAARASAESFKLSPGTCGHPEFCRKPCVHWQYGHCTRENGCDYCHEIHHGDSRFVKFHRRQREWLSATPERELLLLLLLGLIMYIAISQAHVSAEIQ